MLQRRTFKAGEAIIREGEVGESAYIIQKGRVEISKQLDGQRLLLATVGPGDTIGEMSMIDDSVRSATATALEDTEADEIHHEDFFEAMRAEPELMAMLLKPIFERLREANATILRLRMQGVSIPVEYSRQPRAVVWLEGLNPKAESVLPESPLRIESFPYRVGRESHDPLVHNDLTIRDEMPWQISRHHVSLICEGGQVGVMDRGSTLGASVDGARLGGARGTLAPLFFAGSEGRLVLGNENSPYAFRVRIESPGRG